MPRNSSGIYTAPAGTYAVSGAVISASAYDAFLSDLATEVTNSLNVQGTAPMLAALNMGGFKIINGATPVNLTDFATKGYVDTSIPAGTVIFYLGSSAPAGFLQLNGASLSTASYAALFACCGYTFGGAGGSFLLPDARGTFLRGWDNGRGLDSGRAFGSYQADKVGVHAHSITDPTHSHSMNNPAHGHTGGDSGHVHSDAGHTHPGGALIAPGGTGVGGSGTGQGGAFGTGYASIQPASANIFINNGTQNTTANYASTGITATNSYGTETAPKNWALLVCVKY